MSKYLGIDWGKSKIGLALGSDDTGLSLPHKIVKNNNDGLKYVDDLCSEEKIEIIIVGGLRDENNQFSKFIGLLEGKGFKVEVFDERLTSKLARRLNSELGNQDDAVAASLILQSWLENKETKKLRN